MTKVAEQDGDGVGEDDRIEGEVSRQGGEGRPPKSAFLPGRFGECLTEGAEVARSGEGDAIKERIDGERAGERFGAEGCAEPGTEDGRVCVAVAPAEGGRREVSMQEAVHGERYRFINKTAASRRGVGRLSRLDRGREDGAAYG